MIVSIENFQYTILSWEPKISFWDLIWTFHYLNLQLLQKFWTSLVLEKAYKMELLEVVLAKIQKAKIKIQMLEALFQYHL